MKIIVASKNPVKINATREGFKQVFPNNSFVVLGNAIPSGVSNQPLSDEETLQGAINRTTRARKKEPSADFWVGIEGGSQRLKKGMETFAWIVIQSSKKTGKARTSSFFLPKKIITLLDKGKELGDADDIVFHDVNSKQKNGVVGNLTNNVIDRTTYYVQAVILALIPFVHPELYEEKENETN